MCQCHVRHLSFQSYFTIELKYCRKWHYMPKQNPPDHISLTFLYIKYRVKFQIKGVITLYSPFLSKLSLCIAHSSAHCHYVFPISQKIVTLYCPFPSKLSLYCPFLSKLSLCIAHSSANCHSVLPIPQHIVTLYCPFLSKLSLCIAHSSAHCHSV